VRWISERNGALDFLIGGGLGLASETVRWISERNGALDLAERARCADRRKDRRKKRGRETLIGKGERKPVTKTVRRKI
jgi:hypothetical protein